MKTEQIELIIADVRKVQTPEETLEFVIKLYGDEFILANGEIARQKQANDELFRIKQRVVIANGELKRKLAMIANTHHTHELTTARLNSILSGDEKEDLLWRYHNDARFHEFVQRMIAESHARRAEPGDCPFCKLPFRNLDEHIAVAHPNEPRNAWD